MMLPSPSGLSRFCIFLLMKMGKSRTTQHGNEYFAYISISSQMGMNLVISFVVIGCME